MTALLDGPRLAPASGGPARQLIVFVHGYGADGNDLIGLGRQWAQVLPDAAFVSPHAPERIPGAPYGYQWFPISRLDPSEYARGVDAAAPALDAFLDAELARLELEDSALALVGFSQGTMMSLHVGLRREVAPVAILGYSGALAAPERLEGEIRVRPPVMLIHGDADDVIPVQALTIAREGLAAAGVGTQWHISRGIGHGIAPDGLAIGAKFLTDAFGAS